MQFQQAAAPGLQSPSGYCQKPCTLIPELHVDAHVLQHAAVPFEQQEAPEPVLQRVMAGQLPAGVQHVVTYVPKLQFAADTDMSSFRFAKRGISYLSFVFISVSPTFLSPHRRPLPRSLPHRVGQYQSHGPLFPTPPRSSPRNGP